MAMIGGPGGPEKGRPPVTKVDTDQLERLMEAQAVRLQGPQTICVSIDFDETLVRISDEVVKERNKYIDRINESLRSTGVIHKRVGVGKLEARWWYALDMDDEQAEVEYRKRANKWYSGDKNAVPWRIKHYEQLLELVHRNTNTGVVTAGDHALENLIKDWLEKNCKESWETFLKKLMALGKFKKLPEEEQKKFLKKYPELESFLEQNKDIPKYDDLLAIINNREKARYAFVDVNGEEITFNRINAKAVEDARAKLFDAQQNKFTFYIDDGKTMADALMIENQTHAWSELIMSDKRILLLDRPHNQSIKIPKAMERAGLIMRVHGDINEALEIMNILYRFVDEAKMPLETVSEPQSGGVGFMAAGKEEEIDLRKIELEVARDKAARGLKELRAKGVNADNDEIERMDTEFKYYKNKLAELNRQNEQTVKPAELMGNPDTFTLTPGITLGDLLYKAYEIAEMNDRRRNAIDGKIDEEKLERMEKAKTEEQRKQIEQEMEEKRTRMLMEQVPPEYVPSAAIAELRKVVDGYVRNQREELELKKNGDKDRKNKEFTHEDNERLESATAFEGNRDAERKIRDQNYKSWQERLMLSRTKEIEVKENKQKSRSPI